MLYMRKVLLHNFKIIFLLLEIFLSCNTMHGQILKGKIIDSSTLEPIPFATIYVTPDIGKSTTTNINGEFSLNEILSQDSIRVSYVGYETQTFKDPSDWKNGWTISLKSQTYKLPQVIVSNINLRQLVKNIRKKWEQNYPSHYPILEGTYRKQEIEDNELVTLAQCRMALQVPTTNKLESGEKPKINIKNRMILDPIETSGRNLLGVFLFIEPMPYPFFIELNSDTYDNYLWLIEQIIPETDNNEIYKIKYQGIKAPYLQHRGYIYISKKDNALLSAHIERPVKGLPCHNPDVFFHSTRYVWDIFYHKVDEKYQYSYMRTEYITQYSNQLTDKEFEYRIVIDYLVDKRTPVKESTTVFNSYLHDPFRNIREIPIKLITSFTKILPDYE